MTAKIENVPIGDIDANPFRRLGVYPYVENKIKALMNSIADVGLWEGAIGRKKGNRVQIAFAHHRVEAGRRHGLTAIPVIIRDLSDEQMLKFMGRENSEDYNADFLCMLETWEAAKTFLGGDPDRTKVAKLLGWTRKDDKSANQKRCNDTADACALASELIADGHFDRETFSGMTVFTVRQIVQVQSSRLAKVDQVAESFKWDDSKVKKAKKAVTASGKQAAKEFKAGNIAQRDIRAKADALFIEQKIVRKEPALLHMALQPLLTSVSNVFDSDATASRIKEVIGLLPSIINDLSKDDEGMLDTLALELVRASERGVNLSQGLDRSKVVKLGDHRPKRLTTKPL